MGTAIPDNLFANKVAIVTGASKRGNIGMAIAWALGKAGARVMLAARNEAGLAAVCQELCARDITASFVAADLSVDKGARLLMDAAVEEYGRLDILVNNAGGAVAADRGIDSMEQEVWDETLANNLRTTMLVSHHALPLFEAAGGGVITNISSISSLKGNRSFSAYSCAKAGVNALTHTLATQCGSRGIRCNALVLGYVEVSEPFIPTPPAVRDILVGSSLTGQPTLPVDVANAVCFLSSDAACNITGQLIPIDGGTTTPDSTWKQQII